MEEKIITLDETDLDGIVGGAFNQSMINKYDLQISTSPNGTPQLNVKISSASRSGTLEVTGPKSEKFLKENYMDKSGHSISIQTNNGDWKTLSPKEFKSLFS